MIPTKLSEESREKLGLIGEHDFFLFFFALGAGKFADDGRVKEEYFCL